VELPHVQKIFERLSKKYDDLQIIAVEINDDRQGADKFIEENGLTFIFAGADRDFVKEKFNTAYYPNTFIIGRDSRIKQHHVGFRDGQEETFEKELLDVLDAPVPHQAIP